MSSLIETLTECWMVNDTLLLDSNFIIPMVYLVLRLKTLRMYYINTSLFDTRFIGLEVLDLAQSIIESGNQPYKGY